MTDLFITYRRRQDGSAEHPGIDVGGHAGRLYHALSYWFDPTAMFYDLDSLQPGVEFPDELRLALDSARLQLVVIGPGWEGEIERRAATGDTDWVVSELAHGLARPRSELTLLPIWMGRDRAPDWAVLPERLRSLETTLDFRFGEREADWQTQFLRLRDRITKLTGIPCRFRFPDGAEQPYHVLPHIVSRHFQDPNSLLGQLHDYLHQHRQGAIAQAALCGIGGVGKTQLALKYSVDYRGNYAGVWWFRAESPESLQIDSQRLCEVLGTPKAEREEYALALKRWLEKQPTRWLLVYDNADAIDSLHSNLPEIGNHHILITSRNPNWAGLSKMVPLDVWCNEQGADFLQWRLEYLQLSVPRQQFIELTKELGGLPLALEQAAGYLEETACSVRHYRRLLADVDTEGLVLDEGHIVTGYERSVVATLALAYEKLCPAAQQLLGLCAFAAPEPIPERWFKQAAAQLPAELQLAVRQPVAWDKSVKQLRAYGLVERIQIHGLECSPGIAENITESLILHRLTQAVARCRLANTCQAQSWLEVLSQICPDDSRRPEFWPIYAAMVSHAETLLRYSDKHSLSMEWLLPLMSQIAGYLRYGPSLYPQAISLIQKCLKMSRRDFGELHEFTLANLCNLSSMLWASGNIKDALVFGRVALKSRLEISGEEHPSTLIAMNNLANILRASGDFSGSEELQKRVLSLRIKISGENDPETLVSISNLASTKKAQGDLKGAQLLEENLLTSRRKLLGDEHPDTLNSLNNLAATVLEQGDLIRSRALFEEALSRRKIVLGDEHPDTLCSMTNLATVLRHQGYLIKARAVQEACLTLHIKVLGENHPYSLTNMGNLAHIQMLQGDWKNAVKLGKQVLMRRQMQLGNEHPDTLVSMNDLASALKANGDLPDARELQEQALEINRRILGDAHPNTVGAKLNLADIFFAQGDLHAARILQEQALDYQLRKFGDEHPATLGTMGNLAGTLWAQGAFGEARVLEERVLSARINLLGNEHPDTLTAMNNLAYTLWKIGEYAAAIELMQKTTAGRLRVLGAEHPYTKNSQQDLEEMVSALKGIR